MTLANVPTEALGGGSDVNVPVEAAWPRPLLRAAEWAKERRRRRYVAAVRRRLRRFNPPSGQ